MNTRMTKRFVRRGGPGGVDTRFDIRAFRGMNSPCRPPTSFRRPGSVPPPRRAGCIVAITAPPARSPPPGGSG